MNKFQKGENLMNNTKILLMLIALSLWFTACGESVQTSNNLERHIDPRIQGQERKKMLEVMQYVPEKFRDEEVLFLNLDGTLYSNKPEFRNQYSVKVELNSETPSEVTLRSTVCSDQGGLLRRLKTKPGLPVGPASATARFAYSSATVLLPVSSDVKKRNTESAYVYLGGSNPEIDAGLSLIRDTPYWQVLFRGANRTFSINRPNGTYAPGTQVLLEFIAGDGIVEIRYTGLRIGESTSRTSSLFGPVGGYRADGRDNVLKRLNTIAWDLGTGTHAGSFVRNVTWVDSRLGPADPALGNSFGLHTWGDAGFDIDVSNGGDCASPGVTVDSFGSLANETISIATP